LNEKFYNPNKANINYQKLEIEMKKFAYFIIFLVMILTFCGYALAAPQGIARLKEFSGEVMIKNAGSWTQPENGLTLYSGAKIVTKQGTALVHFNDGATMYVDAFSSIRIMDQMKNLISGSDKQVRLRSIRIMLGRTKYEEQPAKGRKTQIELPTAVAALRGTGGWFGAYETGESLGALYEGGMDTFGDFKEIVPKILDFARALNSPTWQASMTSLSASGNEVLNVKEIQAELNTFIANTDPAIRESVQQTLAQVTTVLVGLTAKQGKVEEAQEIKTKSEDQIAGATDDTDPKVTATNTKAGEAADAYVAATKESINADIVLILETLKGDETGMATATLTKAQNDQALSIAEKATKTADNAADLANTATNDTQLNIALSVATTAVNTINATMSTIKTSNASVWLVARDDETGTEKTESLSRSASQTLATAEKSMLIADKAIVAAETIRNEQDLIQAQSLATAAEASSRVAMNALEVNNLAAQAVIDKAKFDAAEEAAAEDPEAPEAPEGYEDPEAEDPEAPEAYEDPATLDPLVPPAAPVPEEIFIDDAVPASLI
jgi:hypothetical protein